jgi:hypothetical protein
MVGQIAWLLIRPERNAHSQLLRIRALFFRDSDARENVKLFDVNFVCERMRFIRHARILTMKPHSPIAGLTIQYREADSRHSRGSGKFVVSENGLACLCISKAVSLAGCGDARVRDRGHVDGHCVSERHEMDH